MCSDKEPTTLITPMRNTEHVCLTYPMETRKLRFFIACFHGVGKTNMTWLEILSFVLVFPKIQLKSWCSVLFLSKKSSLFKTSFWLIDHQKDVDCQKISHRLPKNVVDCKNVSFCSKTCFLRQNHSVWLPNTFRIFRNFGSLWIIFGKDPLSLSLKFQNSLRFQKG